jgi:hypothetical protein
MDLSAVPNDGEPSTRTVLELAQELDHILGMNVMVVWQQAVLQAETFM